MGCQTKVAMLLQEGHPECRGANPECRGANPECRWANPGRMPLALFRCKSPLSWFTLPSDESLVDIDNGKARLIHDGVSHSFAVGECPRTAIWIGKYLRGYPASNDFVNQQNLQHRGRTDAGNRSRDERSSDCLGRKESCPVTTL